MKVVISAGGTGGHIYPALAIIHKIQEVEPNSEFIYIGTHNRMEKDIIPKYNIPFESLEIYGLNRKKLWKNVKTIQCFLKAIKKCKKIMREFKPDIVIGVGGYVTAPVIYSAKKLGYKTFIHEQNSVPGVSNNFLIRYTDLIGVSFQSSMKYFPEYKTVFTGNPCGEEALQKKEIKKSQFGLSENKQLVLFVMGSLGSSKMNQFLVKTMSLFENKSYEILFVTGKEMYEEIKQKKIPKNVKVVDYIDDMAGIMKKTDLMISRSGASTISEIVALRVPSILIPSPYVTNNHQYKNAIDLVNHNAALLIEEKNLKEENLVKEIDSILNHPKKVDDMKKNLEDFSMPNSATLIVKEIQKLISK